MASYALPKNHAVRASRAAVVAGAVRSDPSGRGGLKSPILGQRQQTLRLASLAMFARLTQSVGRNTCDFEPAPLNRWHATNTAEPNTAGYR